MVVEIGDAVGGVYNEEDDVGLFDGDVHLFVDFLLEDIFGVYHPTAGVDD